MENDSKYEHRRLLCAISTALGVSSALVLSSAGLSLLSGPSEEGEVYQDEFNTNLHRSFIVGGIFGAASLFVGVAGCIPLPSFVSKHIASSPSDDIMLIEKGSLGGNISKFFQKSSYSSDSPPSYESLVSKDRTSVNKDTSPPSYAMAVSANKDVSSPRVIAK